MAVCEIEQPDDDLGIPLTADDHADIPIRSDHLGLPLLGRPCLERSQQWRRLHQIERWGTDPVVPGTLQRSHSFIDDPRPVIPLPVGRGGLTEIALECSLTRFTLRRAKPDFDQPFPDLMRGGPEQTPELCQRH